MSSRVFHLYVVHTPKLVLRQQRLQNTIAAIRELVTSCQFEFRLIMVTKPEKVGVEEFDKAMMMLSVEELSNYEKHREVWKQVCTNAHQDIFMVIEDDTFMLPDTDSAFKEMIQHSEFGSHDVVALCLSKDPNATAMEFLNARDLVTVLPSKDAYFVSKRAAIILLEQTTTIRFSMRYQMSYVLRSNPSLRVVYPSKRLFLEGSKIGMYPSSIHSNNMLIYNQEYMELFQLLSKEEVDVRNVRAIYKRIQHLQSPDLMHLYGVLLFKGKQVKEAHEVLIDAIDTAKKQHGIVNFNSDILNNAINIHEFTQWDLDDIMQNSSKYTCNS